LPKAEDSLISRRLQLSLAVGGIAHRQVVAMNNVAIGSAIWQNPTSLYEIAVPYENAMF
jgi:hypothetical protein